MGDPETAQPAARFSHVRSTSRRSALSASVGEVLPAASGGVTSSLRELLALAAAAWTVRRGGCANFESAADPLLRANNATTPRAASYSSKGACSALIVF
jgi:sarcosine oxidase gamma subunit